MRAKNGSKDGSKNGSKDGREASPRGRSQRELLAAFTREKHPGNWSCMVMQIRIAGKKAPQSR
jgi:hypothetical protein